MRQEVAAVRHDDVRGIAAGAPRAEGARVEAEQLFALQAHRAFAAADPRVGHHLVADFDPRGARPERRDLTGDLVPHRERQIDPARCERDLLPTTEIEMPVPYVHVAVADARRLDAQQYLLAHRLGVGVVARFEWLAPFDDLHRA